VSEHFGFRAGKRPPPAADMPVYSLITIVRNAAGTLERTLESVARQTYPALEYIVVDAGSTDGTVELLRRHEDIISYWCSEPDAGAADGANKGVLKATGRYIGFVYADDWLPDDFVEQTVASFARTGADFVFGDMNFHKDGEFLFKLPGDPDYRRKMSYRGPVMNFPSLSATADVYKKVGLYDLAYKVSPDYDWLFRVHRGGCEGAYDPLIGYDFRIGGNSTLNNITGYVENAQSNIRHGGKPVPIWAFAALKIAFHTFDDWLRDHVSARTYVRIRNIRKAITG